MLFLVVVIKTIDCLTVLVCVAGVFGWVKSFGRVYMEVFGMRIHVCNSIQFGVGMIRFLWVRCALYVCACVCNPRPLVQECVK